MGIPIDESLPPTDEAPVEPATPDLDLPDDPEVPPADAAEQASEVAPGWRVGRLDRDFETPEADALDQALEVPHDDPDV